MEFKIDFLRPGKAFPKDTPVYRLRRKLTGIRKKANEQLIMRVGTSVTTLIVSFAILIFSFTSFYLRIYIPRQTNLERGIEEIQQLETMLKSLKQKRQQEQAKRNMIKTRIDQLMSIKNKVVSWTDKLKAINRNLAKGIWLSSLKVKQKALKPKVDEKKQKRGRKAKKKGGKAEGNGQLPSQMIVSINGATYASAGSRPLKLIARFMTDLMNEPIWEKHFDLTDWTLTTSKSSKGDESTEDLKTVNFSLELERKR